MKSAREIKGLLYEQVARIGKAVCSPKRLDLIEILCQGEKNVDQLASATEISVKLASAHLKELKAARLVESRREGKQSGMPGDRLACAISWKPRKDERQHR